MVASRETTCSPAGSTAALGSAAAAETAALAVGAAFPSPTDAPRGVTDGGAGAKSFIPSPLLNINIICSTLAASLEGGADFAFNSAHTASISL